MKEKNVRQGMKRRRKKKAWKKVDKEKRLNKESKIGK